MKFIEIAAILLSFMGIVIFASGKEEEIDKNKESNYYFIGLAASFLSAIFTALTFPLTRSMKNVHFTLMTVSSNGVTFLFTSLAVLVTFQVERETYTWYPFLATLGAGLVFPVLQILGTRA